MAVPLVSALLCNEKPTEVARYALVRDDPSSSAVTILRRQSRRQSDVDFC
jgi:hypothetical protein